MMTYYAVMVSSSPRTGSMWTWNVCADLLERLGKPVLRVDGTVADIGGFAAGERLPDIVCCHTHEILPYSDKVRIVSLIRDIRDVILSAMRFGSCSFDKAMEDATRWAPIMSHYRGSPGALMIRYEDMIADYPGAVERIAAYLELPVGRDVAEKIAATYSRDRVSRIVNAGDAEFYEVYAQDAETLDFREDRFSFLTDRNPNGSIRVIDKRTRFQSGHISSRQPGEWRTVFDPEQIGRIHATFGDWLNTNGYPDR